MTLQYIERNLVNHPPTEETQETMEEVRAAAHILARTIEVNLPHGREKSLAFTKLEETVFWSMASLARNDWDRREVQ